MRWAIAQASHSDRQRKLTDCGQERASPEGRWLVGGRRAGLAAPRGWREPEDRLSWERWDRHRAALPGLSLTPRESNTCGATCPEDRQGQVSTGAREAGEGPRWTEGPVGPASPGKGQEALEQDSLSSNKWKR